LQWVRDPVRAAGTLTDVLIAGFPAGSFAANCYVVAPGPNERCIVIDPGQDAARPLEALLREHNLRPAAVFLTHGHLDHMWSVTPVCGANDIPAYIHPDDRFMLADPLRGVSPQLAAMIGDETFTEPSDVRELRDGDRLDFTGVFGFELVVNHAPGHTKGSVTFRLPGFKGSADAEANPDILFTGDLLFAGSIGRTDLPGGDPRAILESLERVALPLPDDTIVLSGHGPYTTIGRERASNPFLRGLKDVGSARPGL
jgi:glyoxylase-like metal-dependent hydrolase (beta-lactamase superfamily II)